ncbi:hypothetical protein SKAU_G00388630 [Synaphobranchus kaupii]|uniref:Uncharacterized protein n=1 Tax=Synaphobranchus kaupii TaxID=118154 RepID=A0A9Q1IDE3_SYNKA|nr:hypothetical protein SKAU_G00388630 [Synaphobranchus kaupii]
MVQTVKTKAVNMHTWLSESQLFLVRSRQCCVSPRSAIPFGPLWAQGPHLNVKTHSRSEFSASIRYAIISAHRPNHWGPVSGDAE